ncbi:MarR family winged helix-turn-helix transcriptional regulator [Bacillus sp. FJAT-42315]|uniref:MarR family winged helix-turn-helix transcriptional regulator n=1 Tax=Bacillus sp. FJAT-42315 TaxID=2014077 RepID=UPI000C237F73|nr:MarR family transcriptional regulator [Bacillus sp. FJAT-42315]
MNKEDLFNKFVTFSSSFHRVTHELTKEARSNAITPVQYSILEYIAVSKSVTPSDISDCQHMSMPNTSRELKKLTEKNLIERIADTEDRRKHYIRLSKDGELMMKEAFQYIEAKFLNRIKDASRDDMEEIEQALDLLQRKLFY